MQLVVNTPGTFITQKAEIFRLKQKENTYDISPFKVESIIVTNQAMISTQALILALENNIDVIFLDKFGDPMGRVWFSKMGSTALIRRKQLEAADNEVGLELVKEMIGRKMGNQIWFLKKLMHARPGKASQFKDSVNTIERSLEAMFNAQEDLEKLSSRLMGLEGTAGRAYFQCLSNILPEKYRFEGRSRRPAKDPFNAILNYCYGILYSLVERACVISGLDPYVGFLHADNYNKKSMVFDLIEPFRIYGEQTAVYLFTGKKIKESYYDAKEGAVSLNTKGKPVVVEAMNRHMDETIRYHRKNVKRRHILQHEAHRLANILLSEEGTKRPDWLEIREL